MAQSRRGCFCSVPGCSCGARKQPYLSYHAFPTDPDQRRQWTQAVRRDEGLEFCIKPGSTFVCSRHFTQEDFVSESTTSRLKRGVVPSLFPWNNFMAPPKRDSAFGRAQKLQLVLSHQASQAEAAIADHDYVAHPSTGELDGAQQLKQKASSFSLTGPLFERWCVSDEDFRYFTRFPSKEIFYVFWASVEPSASMTAYWSEAKRTGALLEAANLELTPEHELSLIDEFFMFCLHLSVGLKERVLAGMFGISNFRVIQIIVTWSNYLYLALGSVQIWMTRAQVQQMMPPIIRQHCLCTRVIVACTELRCEIRERKTSSETLSCGRNYVTFKALVGIAPCGLITFVSKLFPDSISNDELMRLSGILDLLEPGDEVIAAKNVYIENLLKNVGAKLVAFPLSSEDRYSWSQQKAQGVARLHALVQCVIKRIKENQLLDSMIPYTLAGTVNQIWSCCCLMANYQGRLDPDGE